MKDSFVSEVRASTRRVQRAATVRADDCAPLGDAKVKERDLESYSVYTVGVFQAREHNLVNSGFHERRTRRRAHLDFDARTPPARTATLEVVLQTSGRVTRDLMVIVRAKGEKRVVYTVGSASFRVASRVRRGSIRQTRDYFTAPPRLAKVRDRGWIWNFRVRRHAISTSVKNTSRRGTPRARVRETRQTVCCEYRKTINRCSSRSRERRERDRGRPRPACHTTNNHEIPVSTLSLTFLSRGL